jgi:HD-like signal output (HDOD) protein
VLKVANSPLFGLRAQIDNVQLAIVTLGLARIQALTMSAATANYVRAELKTQEVHRCWSHCIACAAICRSLPRACSLPVDLAYTAGLLHDIGRLGLLVAYPGRFAAMLNEAGKKPRALLQREVEIFGVDHCDAGQYLVGE